MDFTLKEIVRKPGPAGLFYLTVETPDGPVKELLRPSQIRALAMANAGRDDEHNKRAFAFYIFLGRQFPQPGASLPSLQTFAERVGFVLPEMATDDSLAWEAIFGETPEMSSGTSHAPALDIEEEEEDDVLSGLRTQAEGKDDRRSRKAAAK